MGKIRDYISDTGDKVKTSVRIKKETPFFYLSIILIVMVAVLIRMSPVINNTFLIKAFDPWVQYDSTKYLINNGWYEWLNYHDYKMWYPEGSKRYELRPGLLFTAALFYYVATGLGLSVTIFEVVYYFPAIMGGLTVLVMYYLGKEILDERAGLLSAFFLAVSPGHMQRTVCGFYDNETIGVLAVLLVFLFYIKAVKSGKLTHGVMAGLSMGYLSLSWGGLTYPFLLIPLLTMILILLDKYNSNVLMAYAATIGVGELIFSINTYFPWSVMIKEMDFIFPVLFFAFLLIYHGLYCQRTTNQKLYDNILTFIKVAAVPVAITVGIIFWKKSEWIPFGMAGRLESILNPNIREEFNLIASVGEHMPSPWSVFYFNTLIPLLLVIPGIFFAVKRGEVEDLLMLIFVLTLFYFTGSMIRIILLFAPAIALIGGYALGNILKHYGNLMKKTPTISRRRKRQLKRTVGRPEGLVVYIFIGMLLFIQANHAITISTEQMGYSELVAGGYYHDWEETLTWMKYNLPGTAVVVSWWDYGYWITTIGNSTSVNDNGTWNNTRIGLTGMAMMQTDERYSAEIFKQLGADYVLVYFGHLISGLGGDEGKWPWMLRICNDHTEVYEDMGLEKDNWYGDEGQVDTVFDENEYINESSGLYRDKWFDTTLVKLMFADEPTTMSTARTQTQAFFASEIEGSAEYQKQPREDDYGNLWSTHIPRDGNYNFQFFKKSYYSSNSLVKIFKVDYTALDTSFEIQDSYMGDDGIGYGEVKNTGDIDLSVNSLRVKNQPMNFTLEDASTPIVPGDSRYVWFNTNEQGLTWTTGDTFNMSITAQINKEDGSSYTYVNSSQDTQIEEAKDISFSIDRSKSSLILADGGTELYLNIENTGTTPVKLDSIQINNDVFNMSQNVYSQNDPDGDVYTAKDFLIAPGDSKTVWTKTSSAPPADLSQDGYIAASTISKVRYSDIDATSLAYNKADFALTILPGDLNTKPEDKYLYDYNTYSDVDSPYERLFFDGNDDSYLLENGTLVMKVQNDGENVIGFKNLYIDGASVPFEVTGGNYFPDSGEIRTILANVTDIERNVPVKVLITGENDGTSASDAAFFIPRNQSSMISIVNDTNSKTTGFSNESARLVIKNVGTLPVILDTFTINGSAAIDIEAANVTEGSLTIAPKGVSLLELNFQDLGLKFNETDTMEINVFTTTAQAFAETNLTAILPTRYSHIYFENTSKPADAERDLTKVDESDNLVHVMLRMAPNVTVTIDGIYIKEDGGEYQFVDNAYVNVTTNDVVTTYVDNWAIDGPTEENVLYNLYYIDFTAEAWSDIILANGEFLWIKIMTDEGYEVEFAQEIQF